MKGKLKGKRMGRPPLPPEKRKLQSMGFRPTAEVREGIEKSAASSGRSMAQEIERRLERSLQEEGAARHLLGFSANSLLALRCLSGAITNIENETGYSWQEDWDTRQQTEAAFSIVLDLFGRMPPVEDRHNEKELLQTKIREMSNKVAGQNAAISAVQSLMPGFKAVKRLMDERDQNEQTVKQSKRRRR